ncbi:MAG: DciA family protein [Micropruina sp.]
MPDHDPSGLEVARMIAQSARNAIEPPTKKARKPRPKPSRDVGDPQPLGEAINDLISRQGWSTEVNLHHLLGRWPSLVGPVNAAHSTPEHYAASVLTVRTDSSAWASSLRLMAPQLVAKLNEALGQGTVTRIVVKGPDAPSWKHGLRSVRDGRGPRDTYG